MPSGHGSCGGVDFHYIYSMIYRLSKIAADALRLGLFCGGLVVALSAASPVKSGEAAKEKPAAPAALGANAVVLAPGAAPSQSGVVGVDVLGQTQVRYDNGTTSTSRRDVLGNLTTRFSNGLTSTSRTDVIGTTHTAYSNGVTATSRTDVLGQKITQFSDGTSATTRLDVLGRQVTTFADGRTEIIRPDPLATSAPQSQEAAATKGKGAKKK